MRTIGMTMQQVQVNTKFLNALPSERSKFVTDVKLAKSLYTTNYDQLYAYLSQHERHANESPQHSVNEQQHLVSPQPFISPSVTQQSQAEFPQLDSSLDVPMFQQGEDLIECINKAMAFLFAVASRFPPSNNQLRTSSNPRNQATIQDGRVTVQQVQGRQTQSYVGIRNKGIATTSKGNYAAGQPRVVKCYNCQGEWHMILDEEQLAFLADLRISKAPVALQTIPQYSAFQTEDLDAYDSDCDDLSSVKAVLMANLSSCDSDVLSEAVQIVLCKFLDTIRFGNDHIAKIMGYGDYQMGNVTISQVYYVEGLGHNLFSVGQFYDFDLEASTTKSWLWHRRLSHLNFNYVNSLAKQGLDRGLPKLKYQKDHLCSTCALGKSKKHSYKPKVEDSIQEKLYLLHMDLCWPIRVQSINGRKYILVIVDDFSQFTWVKFIRSKDEVPEFVIKFLKMIQVRLNATVCNIRIDNSTDFVNQRLRTYCEEVKISHQTSVAHTSQQNGVV
ncbi:retrovirus-related pol polyprotein from transposon TNT 1-94 [Tanacetum coccineum]